MISQSSSHSLLFVSRLQYRRRSVARTPSAHVPAKTATMRGRFVSWRLMFGGGGARCAIAEATGAFGRIEGVSGLYRSSPASLLHRNTFCFCRRSGIVIYYSRLLGLMLVGSGDGQSADITESSIARRAQASKSGSQAQYISRRYCYACNPTGDSSCYPRTKSQLVMSLAALPLHPSKFVALLEYSRTDEAEAALLIGQTAKAVLLRITTNGLSTTSWRRLGIVARLGAPATLNGEQLRVGDVGGPTACESRPATNVGPSAGLDFCGCDVALQQMLAADHSLPFIRELDDCAFEYCAVRRQSNHLRCS